MNKLTNVLGVEITRPKQELIIMRGIPGAGKSSAAKRIVGKGIIHSTDTIIEFMGDYRAFFTSMIESNDFSPLHKAHGENFKNAKMSMEAGISPVIIDNTNLKANESKKYVVEALMMGYDTTNIKIVDIGTAGLDAETLAKRNSHGVPLEKIQDMMKSHKSVGPLTVKKILDSKDMFKMKKKVLYSAVVLDSLHRGKLLDNVGYKIPQGWSTIANHMTIVFGKPLGDMGVVGNIVFLTVTHIGLSDMAMAVKVEGHPSANTTPHITVAVNPNGGKPVMSNDIVNWTPVKGFTLIGVVTEITS